MNLQSKIGPSASFNDTALTIMARLNMAGLRPHHDKSLRESWKLWPARIVVPPTCGLDLLSYNDNGGTTPSKA